MLQLVIKIELTEKNNINTLKGKKGLYKNMNELYVCVCKCLGSCGCGKRKKRKLISTGDNRRVKDRRESARLKFSNERVHVILLRIRDEENRIKSNNGAMAGVSG